MGLFGKKDKIAAKASTRQRLNLVLMPKRSGKESLQTTLETYVGQKMVWLNADSLADAIIKGDATGELVALDKPGTARLLERKLFDLIEKKLAEYLALDAESTIVLFLSNLELPDYLKMKDKRIYVFIPSSDMFEKIYNELKKAKGEDAAKEFRSSRDNIMMKYPNDYYTFEAAQDITDALVGDFGLVKSAF